MADPFIDVQFSPGTVISSPWLNGINDSVSALVPLIGTTIEFSVTSIAALKLVDKTKYTVIQVNGYYTAGDGGGGVYWYDSSDTVSADNGGTIIVATDGARWKLFRLSTLSVKQFGAKGDGITDDATAFTNCFATGGDILIPQGNFILQTTPSITVSGTRLLGAGRGHTTITTNSIGHCIVVASGLSYIEMRDFTIIRPSIPLGDTQNGIHFSGLTEQAKLCYIRSIGNWHNFRLCATSLSWTEHLFSDNAFGNGIYQTNEDHVAAGMQWEHNEPFVQRSNGWGFRAFTNFGTTANLAPLIAPWSFANKLGGFSFVGSALHPLNGIRVLGGFSGEEGNDSIFVDSFGSVDIQLANFQTEINGTSAVGVNNSTPATATGRGFTITANNTTVFINGCTALGHSFTGILSDCPRYVISGCMVRANGAAALSGERSGIQVSGFGTVTGNYSAAQQFGIFFIGDTHTIVSNDVAEANTTPIGGSISPTASFISNNRGSTVFSPFDSGWTAGTGLDEKGAFSAYTGGTASVTYSQTDTQAIINALVNTSRRVLSIERAIRNYKIIN